MIPAWQAHANLSMISERTNICEGQRYNYYHCSLLDRLSTHRIS
jgi:hypothetical protein